MPRQALSINEFGPESFAVIDISLNKIFLPEATVSLTGFEQGDKVKIAQDENDPAIWYIYKHPDGWKLLHSESGGLSFSSTQLSKMIMECFEETDNIIFSVADKPARHEGRKLFKLFQEEEISNDCAAEEKKDKKKRGGRKPGSKNKNKKSPPPIEGKRRGRPPGSGKKKAAVNKTEFFEHEPEPILNGN